MKTKIRRKLALVLACVMLLTMNVGLIPAASAAGPPAARATVPGGINGYQATTAADADTKDGYKTAFTGSAAGSNTVQATGSGTGAGTGAGTVKVSSDLNGKIWADKSVTDKGDGTFDVTLSALGQTFADKTTTHSELAYDVVFVLDFSGSMNQNGSSKASDMVVATNTAMKTLLKDKPNNRVGIIAYNDSSAETFFALDHYTTKNQDGNFLEYSRGGAIQAADRKRQSSYPFSYSSSVSNSKNETITISKNVTGGTPTQAGIYAAKEMLNTGLSTASSEQVRIPAIVLLSDGRPGIAYAGYQNMDGTQYEGSANSGSSSYNDEVGAYTILTANDVKATVGAAYWKKYQTAYQQNQITQDKLVKFLSVGLGITDSDWTHFVLDPSTTAADADQTVQNMKAILEKDSTYGKNYVYATNYEGGEDLTAEQLEKIFQDFVESIQTGGTITNVGESAGNRNRMKFFEMLGDGMRLHGGFQLTVPTYTVEDNQFVTGDKRVYTLEPHDAAGQKLDPQQAQDEADAGNPVYLKPTQVTVGSGSAAGLNAENVYDKAAQNELAVQIQKTDSGKRMLSVAIPPQLMAYNVLSTKTEQESTTYTYFQSEPVRFTYSAALRSDVGVGSYLAGDVSNCYLNFMPASTQDADKQYIMPYYWGKLWENDKLTKTDKLEGSADYVYETQKDANNAVNIYLGNNGKIDLASKDMKLTVNWKDDSNRDGKRFQNMTVQLYVDPTGGAFDVNKLQPLVETAHTLTVADTTVVDGQQNTDQWTYTFENLKAYVDESDQIAKYYMVFTGTDADADGDRDYTVAVNQNDAPGADSFDNREGDTVKQRFFLFNGYDAAAIQDGHLVLDFTRTPETIDYTVKKVWKGTVGKDITAQLLVRGQVVTIDNQPAEVTMTADNDADPTDGDQTWTYKWENLPKYENGVLIPYRAVETAVTAPTDTYYQTAYTYVENSEEGEAPSTTITNTSSNAEAGKMNFSARVIWDDANNQDGKRPEKVSLKLKAVDANGTEVLLTDSADLTVTQQAAPDAEWTVAWENLPRFTSEHKQITYRAVELRDGTEVELNGALNDAYQLTAVTPFGDSYMTLTNQHTPETRNLTINKVWADADDQDGLRPANANGVLYKRVDSAVGAVRTFTVSQSVENQPNQQTITLTVPRYEGGKEISYYVYEYVPDGYALTTDAAEAETVQPTTDRTAYLVGTDNTITLTNTHTAATTAFTVEIQWDDHNDRDNARPQTIAVQLESNDHTKQTVTLTKGSGGTYGTSDSNVSLTTNEDGSLTLTFADLPVNAAGQPIHYTATVIPAEASGYTATISNVGSEKSIEYTLSYVEQPITLGFTKKWTGDTGHEGQRPDAAVYAGYLQLFRQAGSAAAEERVYAAPQVTDRGNGTYTVTYDALEKYAADDTLYTYTVKESKVPNYAAEQTSVSLQAAGQYETLTNAYAQETYASITVKKVWFDSDDAQKTRPAFSATEDPLGIKLYTPADTDAAQGIAPSKIETTSDANIWQYTWEHVPKYDANGDLISVYTAYETKLPEGYEPSAQMGAEDKPLNPHADLAVAAGGMTGEITNHVKSDAGQTGSITITKNWSDLSAATRPSSLVFRIYGKAGSAEKLYTVTIKKQVTLDPVGETLTATASAGTLNTENLAITDRSWGSLTLSGLPVYENGQAVQYTVEEVTPGSYQAAYQVGDQTAADTCTSFALPEMAAAAVTVTNTFVKDKFVLDYELNGGMGTTPPDQIVTSGDAVSVASGDGISRPGAIFQGWTAREGVALITSEEDLEKIPFEKDTIVVTKNTTLYAVWVADANGNDVPDYDEMSVTVNLEWDDAQNQDGIRPTGGVTVTLETTESVDLTGVETQKTFSLDADSGILVLKDNENTIWQYTWTGLPKAAYTVTESDDWLADAKHTGEVDCAGYTIGEATQDEGVFTIVNTHEPETTSHTVAVRWVDMDSAPSASDATASIQLYGNGEAVPEELARTVTCTAPDEEGYTWDNLPKYLVGVPVVYHAVQTGITGTPTQPPAVNQVLLDEEPEPVEPAPAEPAPTEPEPVEPAPVEPAPTEPEPVEPAPAEPAPTEPEPVEPEPVVAAARYGKVLGARSEDISHEFSTEHQWDDANSTTTIINTYIAAQNQRSITFIQEWNDHSDAADDRPERITVTLYRSVDGGDPEAVAESVTLTGSEDDPWHHTWEKLAIYDEDGNPYAYSAKITAVDGEDTNADDKGDALTEAYKLSGTYSFGAGGTILFHAVREIPSITVQAEKLWVDYNPAARPTSFYLNLLADGEVQDSVPVETADKTYEWKNVPAETAEGTPIVYTVTETSAVGAAGYTSDVTTKDDALKWIVTNMVNGYGQDLTVTYVFNNGQPNETAQVAYSGKAPEKTATYAEHDFAGWYLSADFQGAAYDFDTPVTQDLTLYAKWVTKGDGTEDVDDHTVTFVYQNASATVDGQNSPQTVAHVPCGSDLSFTVAADPDYQAPTARKQSGNAKLTVGDADNSYVLENIRGNVTIVVSAVSVGDKTVTVSYVDNNPDAAVSRTKVIKQGETAPERTPRYAGHKFLGWYADQALTEAYNFDTPVMQDLTLYAKWDAVKRCTVTFEYDNAYATDADGKEIQEGKEYTIREDESLSFTAHADGSRYIVDTVELNNDNFAVLKARKNDKYVLSDVTHDVVIQITAVKQKTGGGGTTIIYRDPEPEEPELEKDDHYAYVIGYEDGSVRPNANITRAEAAAIFFRLMTEGSRDKYKTTVNSFSDVAYDAWYVTEVSTLASAGILTGYPDGTFRPNANITRAELSTIASKFDDLTGGTSSFTDIYGHWAERYINSAYNKGWIRGYPDGTFLPDRPITRAEVMTMVNHVLERAVDRDGMLPDMQTWIDCLPGAWYYEAVQEATNSHDYERTSMFAYEDWTRINPVPDWSQM